MVMEKEVLGLMGGSVGLGYRGYSDTGSGQKPDGQVRARSQRTLNAQLRNWA